MNILGLHVRSMTSRLARDRVYVTFVMKPLFQSLFAFCRLFQFSIDIQLSDVNAELKTVEKQSKSD